MKHPLRVNVGQAEKMVKALRPHFGTHPVRIKYLTKKALELKLCKAKPRTPFLLNIAWKAGLVQKFAQHDHYRRVKNWRYAGQGDRNAEGGKYLWVRYILYPKPLEQKEEDDIIQTMFYRSLRDV